MSETPDQQQTPAVHPPAASIAEALAPFQREAAATRAAVEDRLRVLRRIAVGLGAFVAVTAVLVALVLVILVQNRQTAAKTRAAINTNAELSKQIADCTQVGGTCYEKAQANTGKAIELLLADNKAIAKCARSTATDTAFDACVDSELKSLAPASPAPAR
jgi:hypothetical protein